MDRRTSALIIAPSVQLRQSLLVLLRAIPHIGPIYQAGDISSALSIRPMPYLDLVLCDFSLAQSEATKTLRRIKAEWPETRCVALVDEEQARQGALAAGADVVLTKGVLAARLLRKIEELLPKQPHKRGV
jgi:DNA-binding NarL/FixJ family response regulator